MLRTLADRHRPPPDPRRSTEAQDVALIGRIARGELAAFEAFYRGYHAARPLPRPDDLAAGGRRGGSQRHDARRLERAATFNGQSKVSTWVFAIAYRTALKALRGQDEPLQDPRRARRRRPPRPGASGRLEKRGARRARARARRPVARAAQRPRPHLLPRPAVRRDRADRRLPGRHREDARVFHGRRPLRALLAGAPEDWL
jgi:RNA polymerase sigma-70 factor (ECF subfamily)